MPAHKHVVQVVTVAGWRTITKPTTRSSAHALARRLNARVFNTYTRSPSLPSDEPETDM